MGQETEEGSGAMTYQLINGDCLTELQKLPPESVQTCVTSPPYWGLRDYGTDGQLGLEQTPEEYVANMVQVFREVKRVLRDDGTLWLNLGDSYYNYRPGGTSQVKQSLAKHMGAVVEQTAKRNIKFDNLKEKDLVGIPWRVAFALQADGWYLRSDIIWHKPNPMPESVTDRPTKAHEYIFLLTKSAKYYYDHEAIMENTVYPVGSREDKKQGEFNGIRHAHQAFKHISDSFRAIRDKRNKRSVWTVNTRPFSEAHFATFPPKLIEPCILAGCPTGGIVLDPFAGAGTTLLVAENNGRNSIGIELNSEYCEIIKKRLSNRQTTLFEMGAEI